MAITEHVTTKNLEGWGIISLPEYLDINKNADGWGRMKLWHITTTDRVEKIKEEGLTAGTCAGWMSSGMPRSSAVYFFCDPSVLKDMMPLVLGDGVQAAIVEVTIPADQAENIFADNFWNMEFEKAYMSAVKFLSDTGIPSSWITNIK